MSPTKSTAMSVKHMPRNKFSLWAALKAELIKFRSLRSLIWLSIAGGVVQAALGPIQIVGLVVDGGQDGSVTSLSAAMSLALTGVSSACMVFGILGVLTVTTEYPSGAIRGTFIAVPRRGYVVTAKLLAYIICAGAAALLASVVAVASAVPGLAALGFELDLIRLDVLRVVIAAALYLVLWGCYGQLLGWLIRSTVGATMALLAFFFVLTGLTSLFPQGFVDIVAPLLPSEAAASMLQNVQGPRSVTPGVGALLSVSYVLIGAAWMSRRVTRRDA